MTDAGLAIGGKLENLKELSDEQRIKWIRSDHWFELPQALLALKWLEDLLLGPRVSRMPCLLIFGPTGMGKTRILERFVAGNSQNYDARRGLIDAPVVSVQMPPEPKEVDFYTSILDRLNVPSLGRKNTNSLSSLAMGAMKDANAKILIIDEIDKLLCGTGRQQRLFLSLLRYITNELKVSIVCGGTENALTAVYTDPNLADRFGAFELERWVVNSDFQSLLASFSAFLPLRRQSDFIQRDVAKLVISMTNGVTARIFRLFEALGVEAIRSGQEMIDAESFNKKDLLLPLVSMQPLVGSRKPWR